MVKIINYAMFPLLTGFVHAQRGDIFLTLCWQIGLLALIATNWSLRNHFIIYEAGHSILAIMTFSLASNTLFARRATREPSLKLILASALIISAFHIPLYYNHDKSIGLSFYRIEGTSMQPTLSDQQWIVIDLWAYKLSSPKAQDIVVFRLDTPNSAFSVKRVAKKNNAGEYVLIGDNMDSSYDSRHHGPVNNRNISGKVIAAKNKLP